MACGFYLGPRDNKNIPFATFCLLSSVFVWLGFFFHLGWCQKAQFEVTAAARHAYRDTGWMMLFPVPLFALLLWIETLRETSCGAIHHHNAVFDVLYDIFTFTLGAGFLCTLACVNIVFVAPALGNLLWVLTVIMSDGCTYRYTGAAYTSVDVV